MKCFVYPLATVLSITSLPPATAFAITSPVVPTQYFSGRTIFNWCLQAKAFDLDEIERRALAASEAWDIEATPFLEGPEASAVEERLGNRADCAVFRAGGYPGSSRSRFVLTNPELGLDADTASSEHTVVLRVSNADLRNSDPFPNLLVKIGVELDDVGDIVFDGDNVAYLVVTPGKAEKACLRLLSKELVGTGITVAPLEAGETVSDDGDLQEMKVQRLDRREQKRRK